jgi:uncharacterized protein (DUF433 family)
VENITIDPLILGGTPCFSGTRVPISSMFDHLRRGYTVDYFLTQFPTVTRAQAEAVLDAARDQIAKVLTRAAG